MHVEPVEEKSSLMYKERRMRRNKLGPPLQSLLLIVGVLLLFIAGVTACGNSNNQANAHPSSTATAAPTMTPIVSLQSCGVITKMGNGPSGGFSTGTGKSDPQSVGNCFLQAYQACTSTSFTYVVSSVDTITTRTFQLQKSGSTCQIHDTVQSHVLPRPARTTGVYTCALVKKQDSTLQILHCQDDGTIVLSIFHA
jgi:hypothetical protein